MALNPIEQLHCVNGRKKSQFAVNYSMEELWLERTTMYFDHLVKNKKIIYHLGAELMSNKATLRIQIRLLCFLFIYACVFIKICFYILLRLYFLFCVNKNFRFKFYVILNSRKNIFFTSFLFWQKFRALQLCRMVAWCISVGLLHPLSHSRCFDDMSKWNPVYSRCQWSNPGFHIQDQFHNTEGYRLMPRADGIQVYTSLQGCCL